jgi:hypothetical protein
MVKKKHIIRVVQEVIFDTIPPYVFNTSPSIGQTSVDTLEPLRITIMDDMSGIDMETIILRINGIEISSDDYEIENIDGGHQ